MENLDANQLPEVDAMPDGFVDSSREPVAPATPTVEQEKPRSHNTEEDTMSDLHHANLAATRELSNESTPSQAQRTEKTRTFPVPLSETDSSEGSGHVTELTPKGEEDIVGVPNSVDQVSEASPPPGATSNEAKYGVYSDSQSSPRCNCPFFHCILVFLELFLSSWCGIVCNLLISSYSCSSNFRHACGCERNIFLRKH
ncbi:unnamed protein product [Linum tenue]|uniref:Uncharacterized protein n=1 Tax=Linum tenue TaxID=586396 RepID=A0AAV0JP47_9ROSI|nr:unnamed protein product [Linum tenue]